MARCLEAGRGELAVGIGRQSSVQGAALQSFQALWISWAERTQRPWQTKPFAS